MPEMTDYYMSNAEYEYRYNPSVTKSVAHSIETDLEDARKLLQVQIAGLRNASLTIRRRGVPLPAIHHLPEELLCFILRYLMSEDRPSGTGGLGWINAMHVCRYWRMVALSNPTLWWCLNFNLGRQWATAVLARSQDLPLEINLTVLSGEEYEYADYLVWKCLKRAISLFVVVPQALPGRLDGMLIGPAPLLESFELSYDIENVNPKLPILPDTTPYTLPATFLDHANCPRLESISLSRCTIPLGAPLNLTALALNNLIADDILPIFQLLPQLQRLSTLIVQFHRSVDLHGEVNLHGEVEKWDTIYLSLKPITMPHLANFHLKGRNPECSMVIGNLIAPRLSQFFMKCTITTGCLEEFAEVIDALEDFIEHSGITAKDQAGVSASVSGADVNPGDRACKLEVFSWSTPEHACASSSEVSNGLSVEFSWPDDSVPPLLRLAGDVCHAARLGDVHTLDLDLEENLFDADVLQDTLSLVQRLDSLHFLSIDGLTDNDEDDVLVLLSGKDYLRSYEHDTMEGYHYEVVRSAVPKAYEPSDTPTTPVPISPSNDETNDPLASSSPLP